MENHVSIRYAASSSRRLTPALLLAAAVAALGWLGCGDGNTIVGPTGSEPRTSRAGTPPGQEIQEAIRAQERHTPALMALGGVVGTGVGLDANGEPVVRVFTTDPGVRGIPAHVDNVPVDIKVTGLIVAGSNPTTKARPSPVGFSVGHTAITAGTIGGVVIDGSGNSYILSNNHVLANSNDANIGDAVLQPGPADGGTLADQIGTLADFEPINFQGQYNKIDAAIASVSPADVNPSTPADDGYGTPSSTPYALDSNSDGSVDPGVLGLSVQKYGRTTSLTSGTVTEINVVANICYEVLVIFCLKSALFEDLLGFPAMSQGGDSGSSIVTADGLNNPVALLFAGSANSTLASRIDLVLQRFGVAYDDGSGTPPPDQTPTASFTWGCNDLACSFDGTGSTDDGSIVSYDWDFGDGNVGSGSTVNHSYASGGMYDVILTVTDDAAQSDTDTQTLTATEPGANQAPTASFTWGCNDLACSFDGTGSTDDGNIVSYDWNFGDGNVGSGSTANHTYGSGGTYDVTLTVVDDGSLSDDETQSVTATDPPAGSPTLTASGRKEKGQHVIDLSWSNVPWTNIYVFRAIGLTTEVIDILPGSSSGTYSDYTGSKGKGTYTHFLCAGTGLLDPCTNWVTTQF